MSAIPLVINGLHRSGTTMTERLFDSQKDIICFGLFFQIIRAISYARGFTDKGIIMMEDFEMPPNAITEQNDLGVRIHFMMDHVQRIYEPYLTSKGDSMNSNLLHGCSRETLLETLDIIGNHRNLADIGSLLEKIGQKLDVKICATRWTAHHRYAPVFLKNPRAYWIEVIRNPYSRIASERVSHKGYFPLVIQQQQDSLNFVSRFKHPHYKVIKYENLCMRTDDVLEEISEWLGVKISNVELTSTMGGVFRPNTSDNVRRGKGIYDGDPSMAPKINALDLDRWKEYTSYYDVAILNTLLKFRGLYKKENINLVWMILGIITGNRIKFQFFIKNLIKSLLKTFGILLRRI